MSVAAVAIAATRTDQEIIGGPEKDGSAMGQVPDVDRAAHYPHAGPGADVFGQPAGPAYRHGRVAPSRLEVSVSVSP